MEFFNKAKVVRLRSHLDKYLIADENEETVRQSRNATSRKAQWAVEFPDGQNHIIRLKSCYGRYLTASDVPFLLGVTGKKVIQTVPATNMNTSIEWEPIKEGFFVKLRTKSSGKFLRANGGTPPWRNTVTHDVPHRTATQDWVLWDVDVIDVSLSACESLPSYVSPVSSFSSSIRSLSIVSDGSGHSSFSSSRDDIADSKARSLSVVSNRSAQASGKQNGMVFFDKAKAVRLESHFGKYLVADEDEETVRQSRNATSRKAQWAVEFPEGQNHIIRLKSCYGRYLTASDEPFLLGVTGKKVIQTVPATNMNTSIEWEPIREGFFVKLRTKSSGKFLRANGGTPPWMRANGGTPPWRNSITHDVPHRTATQDWVLWGVDVVDICISDHVDSLSRNISSASSFSSSVDDFTGSPDTGSPSVVSGGRQSGMELFHKAQTVRLRSHHDKFLLAEEDQESVCQDRHGSIKRAKWTVEFVDGIDTVIRLKSCYGKYLTATDEQYLLGVTGRRVSQTLPKKLDSKVEWEPLRDGFQVRLKTRYGNYLRANGGLPPWRNSITHDIPQRHTDWILWEVDVVEIRPDPPTPSDSVSPSQPISPSFYLRSPKSSKLELNDSGSPMKSEGRIIYYSVVDDDDGKIEEGKEEPSFHFKGLGLEELTEKLEEETGLEDVIVCLRNPWNGKLSPLRLDLPPNNTTMHIVVVPSASKAASEFAPDTSTS
ncbi:uncharacterized protein LOC114267947 [Camellia sinensis]|uniref:uncharacterized protein LOC114267947 n=1 Tax=Camellia sinensis TaxID=4442 RepID=UPI001036C9EE|nr:uncharacterized protein LOC114267947 [Camellia sinensis]